MNSVWVLHVNARPVAVFSDESAAQEVANSLNAEEEYQRLASLQTEGMRGQRYFHVKPAINGDENPDVMDKLRKRYLT